jgi:choline dehydrogenase-like flavoprotein
MPSFDAKPTLAGPHRPVGFYVPRFRNLKGGEQSKTFLRGYGYEGDTSVDFNWLARGFGEAYKKSLREPQTEVNVLGFGEVLPRYENFVEIDKEKVDAFGIPVLRIHMANGPNETAMIKDMADSAGELLQAAGARNIRTFADPANGRWAVHEAGIARMGSDPKKSVLTQFQQTHDVKNLFVMDASGFPSNPCQNPTLTIMALCVRSCDFLMGEMKSGSL